MDRFRPLPEIDGPIITSPKVRSYRWPFFAFEGGRWTYRSYGIGKPVTVTLDEVVAACVRLHKRTSFFGYFVLGVAVVAHFYFTGPNSTYSQEFQFLVSAFIWPVAGLIVSAFRLVAAHIMFRKFDHRPRFGHEVKLADRLVEILQVRFWSVLFRPGNDVGLVFWLLFMTFLFWLSWGTPALIVGGGISIATLLAVLTHRFNETRKTHITELEGVHEESDVLLTAAMEQAD